MDGDFICRIGKEQILVGLDDAPEDASVPRDSANHDHADFELHILLRGSCLMDLAGRMETVSENQALLIAPGLFHHPTPTEDTFERLSMTVSLEPGLLRQALEARVPQWEIYGIGAQTAALCRGVFAERMGELPCRQEALTGLLTLLLIDQFRALEVLQDDAPALPSTRRYTEIIDPYFEENLGAGATVEGLAEVLHLSRSQVNRVLKKHYGMTFREKLVRARMDQAAWLLRQTDRRVDEIARQVGYTAKPSFYQVFRERMGMTPEQYRQKHRP